MKDLFSDKPENYGSFRPGYPSELFVFLKDQLNSCTRALDCGTGNGQIAGELAKFMEEVEATDISPQQLGHAVRKNNINYSVQQAEKLNFPDNSFDLITVGQAIHWFDFSQFYREALRTLKPTGLIAIVGYGLFRTNPETNALIDHFYNKTIGPYWEPERRYLEEAYKTIPFPFYEIHTPDFFLKEVWNLERLKGYLRTWSAVKKYDSILGKDPVQLIENDLEKSFGNSGEVLFPILIRLGKIY